MMQVIEHQIVDVPGMGYGLVPAALPVGVADLVAFAGVAGGAPLGVRPVRGERVLVDVVLVGMVHVAVV